MKTSSLFILMLSLLLLVPAAGGSAQQGTRQDLVTTVYLPYADTTLIYSDLGQLALSPSHRSRNLTMQISAEHKGKDRAKPEFVELKLFARPRWSISDEHKPRLLIFADRRTFDARGPDKSTSYSISLDLEWMYFTLPREQFLQVAKARTVRPQLDGVDLDLTDAQLKRLQAFANELQ